MKSLCYVFLLICAFAASATAQNRVLQLDGAGWRRGESVIDVALSQILWIAGLSVLTLVEGCWGHGFAWLTQN